MQKNLMHPRKQHKNLNKKIKQSNFSYTSNKRKPLKKLIIACLSALFIGLSFGFIMLNVIQSDSSIDEQLPLNTKNTTVISEQSGTTGEESTVPSLSAYTVQLGVFSKDSNAREYIEQLNLTSDELMIWSRDSSYYVFSGIAQSMEQVESILTSIQKDVPDSFKKHWQTDELNIVSSENVVEWLEEFVKVWELSLADLSKIPEEQWEKLVEAQRTEESLSELKQSIEKLLAVDSKSPAIIQQKLLNIWFQFEELLFALEKNE